MYLDIKFCVCTCVFLSLCVCGLTLFSESFLIWYVFSWGQTTDPVSGRLRPSPIFLLGRGERGVRGDVGVIQRGLLNSTCHWSVTWISRPVDCRRICYLTPRHRPTVTDVEHGGTDPKEDLLHSSSSDHLDPFNIFVVTYDRRHLWLFFFYFVTL